MKWRIPEPCADCPFNETGPGRELRDSLARGRWKEILDALRADKHFICHKTAKKTGDGSELQCAGSLNWCEENLGTVPQLARIMERLGGG